jgi:glycosyltransferase involved in cell wall biosynthesis
MRVLFLTSSYPVPEHPWLGIFVREHARAVAPHAKVAVALLDRSDDTRTVRVEDADGEFMTVRARYPRRPSFLSYVSNIWAAVLAYRRLRRRGFEPDVIHAHFFLAGVPAVVLGRLFRKPVVVTEQWSVFLPDDPVTLSPAMQRAARFAYERAAVVMPVSTALRDGIRAIGAEANFRIVPNVVDTGVFHPNGTKPARSGPTRLIGVGSLYDAKGWEHLLDALALVDRELHLDLIGDGILRPDLEARAAQLGVADKVTFHGWRPKEEVAERLREADLFVITSQYDSNPCAVIEALASGVPVVATAVGGIPEMVTDGMGLLAEPGDPDSIADAIDTALAQTWDHDAIARTAGDRYGLARVGADFAAIYDEALTRRRRP